jgi:hypothetical protein
VSATIACFRDLDGEPFLSKVMPVDFFHGASGNARACVGSARAIRGLLTPRWIVLVKNPLDNKINALRVASLG